jgi:hypothetical protein
MLTMREISGEGFGKKAREWNDPERLEAWREHWALAVNQELERHGHEARVDHRSLADQGIDREPEPKQGPVATEMERQGRPSNAGDDRRAVQQRNAEREAVAAELQGVTAEIIVLSEARAKRAATGSGGREEPQNADEDRTSPTVGTTQGGMVAQQSEALDRFHRNSKALEKQRQAWARLVDQAVEQQAERDQANLGASDRARQRDVER